MSYLKDLLGEAYHEGMTEEEISKALESSQKETDRLKSALSKTNSEAAEYKRQIADYKKQLEMKMTEDEKKKAEEAEKLNKIIEENNSMRKQLTISENKAKLLSIGYSDDLAYATAEAMFNADMETVMKNQLAFLEKRTKEIKAEAMMQTPKPQGGNGGLTITKKDFDAMTLSEKMSLYEDDPETYNKLKEA